MLPGHGGVLDRFDAMLFCLPAVYYLVRRARPRVMRVSDDAVRCAASPSSARPVRSAPRRSTSSAATATSTRWSRSPPARNARAARRRRRRSSASRSTRPASVPIPPTCSPSSPSHPDVDVVLNAVVGFAGLPATLAALEHGKRLALANKESLIAGGPVVAAARDRGRRRDRARRQRALRALPVPARRARRTRSTARSSPPAAARSAATPASRARRRSPSPTRCAHPTWDMGAKITIDSSTLMNKGLEVIEAHELFGIDFDRIDVVVHPQSMIHSMVEFVDGATIAQLSMPDMRLPDRARARRAGPAAARRSAPSTGPACRSSRSRRPTSTPSRACASPSRPAGPGGARPRC